MPSIAWLTARAEIATILTGVAISSPVAATIKRVYETPHKHVTDLPCVVVVGTAKPLIIRSSGLREREYVARLRLVIDDADLEQTADMIDAFEEAIIDAFDANLTLNGKVSNLNGPAWEEPETFDVGGQTRWGADALVSFRMFDDPGFAG